MNFSSFLNSLQTVFFSFSSFLFSFLLIFLVFIPFSSIDSNPSTGTSKFVDLLNSQQTVSFGNHEDSVELSSSQLPFLGSQRNEASSHAAAKERRKWTPQDDIVLISSWLNTSKDTVVGNDQKAGRFWARVSAYFEASHNAQREPSHCKQRWHRINDLVAKFSGAYDAATREKSSGQNENDVVKLAHQIFYNNHQKRFTLEHAWKELRNDQKWCDLTSAKNDGSSKKRKCEDPADSSTHEASDSKRPPGVKAAKATGKNKEVQQHTVNEFQNMWTIREKDMAVKERMAKMSMLEGLIGRTEGLDEEEKVLKKKLITDVMSS
ncbi:BnaA05g35920D [Brassica napus]|uniref:BnaA05g35920D protein n=1 Tax=Brassica napus TaxID=3708 RepID=A0A078ITE9_BRANA|nr:BnaA05g35920D [Brassica napus]